MSTVFETRLIGNIGKDATQKNMEKGVIAISFPVAHNKNWKDRRSGESKTKTTWVNCTIWKREGSNLKIVDYLKKGTMVELIGTTVAKAFQSETGEIFSEIRLNVTNTNILKLASNVNGDFTESEYYEEERLDGEVGDLAVNEEEF